MFKLEEPCCPLDIRQPFGRRLAQVLEGPAGRHLIAHMLQQIGQVPLQYPEQIDDLSVEVIGHLAGRPEAAARSLY